MPLWLLAIAFSVFVFYTDDYMIAGVLPELASDLHVSESLAGQLVSVYSLILVIGSPLIAFASARRSRFGLFAIASAVFIVANVVSVVADSLWLLMVMRVLAACASAACVPSMFAVVSNLAPPERRIAYVGIASAGVVGALALGVPLGTLSASLLGWHGNFGLLAVLSAISVLLLAVCRATLSTVGETATAQESLASLTSRPIATVLLGNTVLIGGSLMLFTYFGPFAASLSGPTLRQRGLLLAVAGTAGLIGSVVGGIFADKRGASNALRIGFALFFVTMIAFSVLSAFAPVPTEVLVPLTIAWALSIYWNVPAFQVILVDLAPESASRVLALNSSSTYLGVTIGSIVGGMILSGFGPPALPICAAILGAAAFVIIGRFVRGVPTAAPRAGDTAEGAIRD
jgi:predicted MFS family arabinose efflux permease